MTTIREQLNGIERSIGAFGAKQDAADESRRDLSKKVDNLVDNVGDALALGPEVHALAAQVATQQLAINKIEAWRQRKIGAAGLLHALGAMLGAIVGAAVERWHH